MAKARILMADDDRLVLATVSAGLRSVGYEVVTAETGEEAIRLCNQWKPDLAILDIRMPGIDGIEAARQIFSDSGVPFLILSAFDDKKMVDEAVSEGALGFLVKPIDVYQIIPSIEAALVRADEIRELRERESNLSTALTSGRETNIAIGLIMAQSHLSAPEAEEKLRNFARSHRRKMSEVAAEIIRSAETINVVMKERP